MSLRIEPKSSSAVLALLALCLVASLVGSGLSDAHAATGSERDLSAFHGRWRLDRDASDSFEPVMEALEVSWLLRRLARVATAELSFEPPAEAPCDTCPTHLVATLESPVRTATFSIITDGKSRPAEDPAGNAVEDRYSEPQPGELLLERERKLPSGKQATIQDRRHVDPESGHLLSTLTVRIDGELRVTSNRVFVPAD